MAKTKPQTKIQQNRVKDEVRKGQGQGRNDKRDKDKDEMTKGQGQGRSDKGTTPMWR
jgi:hypothetical protein